MLTFVTHFTRPSQANDKETLAAVVANMFGVFTWGKESHRATGITFY